MGISLTRTTLDGLAITDGTMAFDTVKSTLARAALRGGTSINVQDKFALQPFAQLSVWHEFEDQATSTVTLAGTPIPLSVTRVGTFYQGTGGVTFQILGTGFLMAEVSLPCSKKLRASLCASGLSKYSVSPSAADKDDAVIIRFLDIIKKYVRLYF